MVDEKDPSPSPPPPSPPPPSSSEKSPPPPKSSKSPPPPPPKNSKSSPPPPSPPRKGPSPPPPKGSARKAPPRPIGPPGARLPSHRNAGGSSRSQNLPIIIGVVAGVGLLLIIVMVLLCILYGRKKKKKSNFDQMPYYNSKASANSYYISSQRQQYENAGVMPSTSHRGAMGRHPNSWDKTSFNNRGGSSHLSSEFSGPYGPQLPPPHPTVALGFNQSTFTFDELAAATQGFAQSNLLGQGGFGYVHKGVLPNGKEIAVKSLKSGSGQGEREFQAEVEIISRVHHRHLVSLVGYCIAGGQRMLVYEFLPNDTLEFHLHEKTQAVLEWPIRLKIALGMAKGLAYLHEDCYPRIIHRDIKTSNILLDSSFDAKVADFGLAKLSQDNFTHVSTRVMGTFGYLAPEYASSGKLTDKSDVFSFGVMLLELLTGRRPIDHNRDMDESLVEWARPLCLRAVDYGDFEELVDPRLGKNYAPDEMKRMVACAVASVRHSARRRPKMSQIVRALEGDILLNDLTQGVRPGQSPQFNSISGSPSPDYDTGSFNKNTKKLHDLVLNSQEYSNSESDVSSEHPPKPLSSDNKDIDVSSEHPPKPLSSDNKDIDVSSENPQKPLSFDNKDIDVSSEHPQKPLSSDNKDIDNIDTSPKQSSPSDKIN